ncbi:MAG TPA: RICIN domain-containing protein [Pseudolysinimonas sp.]|nr:RICIN domain-containing protein [Pseudolysinimonas sp.]
MTERIRTPWRAAVIAAIVTLSVVAGAAGSWAYWSASGTATLGVGAATLSTTATGWSSTTLGNETIAATGGVALTSTGSVTITNTTSTTSTQTPTLTASFTRASGSSALAAATTLTVWPVASAAACTPSATPTGATSGTWSAGVTVTTPLGAGASQVYCLRNTISDRQAADDASGALTFTPQLSAQLGIGSFTGGATATSTISTQYLYPLASVSGGSWNYIIRAGSTWCWDVSGYGSADGSALIAYGCKNNSDTNQDFRFVDSDGDGYGDIQPRHATNLRVAAATSTASGSAVDMRTADTGSTVQQWQPQVVATGVYQFVNRYSGLCLSLPAVSTGVTTQVTCTGAADQKFTFTQRAVIPLSGLTCSNTGTGSGRSVQYDWSTDYAAGVLTIEAKPASGSTWTTLGTTSGTAFAFDSPVGAPFTSTGGYDIRITNSDGDVLATDSVTTSRTNGAGRYYYVRC